MFFCAISGEPPQDPVISTKSGHIYERRLVQKYITENGTDPVTGEKLEESDLVSVKASAYSPAPSYVVMLSSSTFPSPPQVPVRLSPDHRLTRPYPRC